MSNSSLVGLAFTQQLRDGIKVTLSSQIDTKNLNQGGHKIGLGLDFQAWAISSALFSDNILITKSMHAKVCIGF